MQHLPRIGGLPPIDLAAADILRSRETGVANYNAFRRLLRLPARGVLRGAGGRQRRARARDP